MFIVADHMNGVLMHADKNESVVNIARLMYRNNADAVMIRENGVPVGLITNKELLSGLISFITDPEALSVEKIMRTPLLTIEHDEEISSAWELMRSREVEHLPVKKDRDIIGLMVQRDLILDLSWYRRGIE
jgi:predicted transcriptional regulator